MTSVQEAVATIIREMVIGSGLSQPRIAAGTGIDKGAFSLKIRGHRPWSLSDLEALGKFFRTSGSEILRKAEQMAG